jgi:hypothetical protein
MKRLALALTLLALLLALPIAALANQGQPSMDTLANRGWDCPIIAGGYHCFNPGEVGKGNASNLSLMVFNLDGKFLGTEILWNADHYAGQPCPQDFLIDLGDFIACHRYAQ